MGIRFQLEDHARKLPRVLPSRSCTSRFQRRHRRLAREAFKVDPESDLITSFYLRSLDGQALRLWEPGQFLPIRVTIPGQKEPAVRTYTISTSPNPDRYRLSIRLGDGIALVSQFLHAQAKPGFRLEAAAPRGRFVLNRSNSRTPVLISGGVGIAPMIAMLEHIVDEGQRTGLFRPAYFIHGTRNRRTQAFSKHIRNLASIHPGLKVHICYSQPEGLDNGCDSEGRVSIETLKQMLSLRRL